MGELVEEAERESLVDVVRSVSSSPVNFGYRIRDMCSLMSECLEAKEKEIHARQSMAAKQTECSDVIKCERARMQLFKILAEELRTLKEVTYWARKRSVEIERFMTKFCLPVWRETLGRHPFGKIRFALDALDNAPNPTRKQIENFEACREALSREVDVYILSLEVSPAAKPTNKKGSARNKDGTISLAKVQKVRDEIKRFRENNGREPTRTELRQWKSGISNVALKNILDQLFDGGEYQQPARKRRRPEQS